MAFDRANRGLPFRPTLITLVVAVIVLGAGGVAVSAWVTSSRVVDALWRSLARELTDATTQRTLRFLEPAVPYVKETERLVAEGRLDPDDPDKLLDHFLAAVVANPQFTWCSYARTDGRYATVHRQPDGEIHASVREQLPARPDGTPVTRIRDLTPQPDGTWKVVKDDTGSYDPRTRAWYQTAVAAPTGVWVEPFLFATNHQPGFMYVARTLNRDGSVRGVWTVEFEVSYLSEFLASLHIGDGGRVYVVTRSGLVVGHPGRQVTSTDGDKQVIARAATHPDPMLAGAWRELDGHGAGERSFRFASYLASAGPFPKDSGIDWEVLVVVPAEDVFGHVEKQALIAVLIASLVAMLAIAVGILFSNRVSGALRGIADEMDRVGRFDVSPRDLHAGGRRFVVREVLEMALATERMKASLRSFSKYVPRDLVARLIHSGQEAVLGGQQSELTVLFSDIAGFTSISEKLPPTTLVEMLGEYLATLSMAITEERGTVDKFIGDAVMAFWGAPTPLEDHPLRACRAALAMKRAVAQLNLRWGADGKPTFSTRIGLNTGTVVVGNIGSPDRMNYTVMGDAVNVASRLEGLNKEYTTTVLIGEETAVKVRHAMVLRPLDWVAVKGRARGTLVYELVGDKRDVSEDTVEAIEVYQAALGLYRARAFAVAARKFEQAAQAFGGEDAPSLMMAERSRKFAAEPPPDDWDGVFTMQHK